MANWYQESIHDLDNTVNPAGVEAFMRVEYGPLDYLPLSSLEDGAKSAKSAEAKQPGLLEMIAESKGLADDYADWQKEMA